MFLRKRAVKKVGGRGAAQRARRYRQIEVPGPRRRTPALDDADIERLIDERAAARKAKNFKESDRIRDLLASNGVQLEDQPGGRTLWRRG